MLSSKIIQVVFLWSLVIQVKCDFNDCPRFCKCDIYNQLNRAECSSRRLISAELEIPNVVQILDLSYNDITTIESKSFKSYRHLKHLNLSHNSIYTLELEAFSHLRRLLEIDLSYNRLQYLDERLFERNHNLKKLNLEANKFMSISLKPLIKSTSLMDLNLKNSQITFTHTALFSELPNLEELDLSQNLLNTFLVDDFKGLKKLKFLKLSENSIRCDMTIRQNLQQMLDRDIQVYMDECKSLKEDPSKGVEKFQKIVVIPETKESTEDGSKQHWRFKLDVEDETFPEDDYDYHETSLDVNKALLSSNEWLRFAPDSVLCEPQKFQLCQNYRKCLENLNTAWHEKHSSRSFSTSEAKFGFFLGVACGVTSVICLLTCVLCLKNCCKTKRRDRLPDLDVDMEPFEIAAQPLARPPQQLPPQVRRQPRRRAPIPPRAVVRYEGPVGENFLSRLFGRPSRHQYYRTINQNTATLIRRLSRSNLFNNRLSQHILDRQFSSERSAAGTEAEDCGPSAPRPETPPPSYGDVIVEGCAERK